MAYIRKLGKDRWRAQVERATLRDAMEKYAREVSPTKRRERNESNRLTAFCRDFPQIADKVISDIRTPDLARWRDARLAKVTPASVERDLRLISHVFATPPCAAGWHH